MLSRKLFISVFFLLFSSQVFSQKIILLQPSGDSLEALPIMHLMDDSSEIFKTIQENINNSFISNSIRLYDICQTYLKNTGQIDTVEPAYLAITQNDGGFAKFGFVLEENGTHTIKREAAYIDITESRAMNRADALMSFTQLYPHEMGHVFYKSLCPEDSLKNNTKNVDMHFYSVITDYWTGFNEGFAEHLENVSRHYEENDSILLGIKNDSLIRKRQSPAYFKGFKNDFLFPFRLGYFKATMIGWFQKYEDLKRYEQSFNGDIKYHSKKLKRGSAEDRMSYRNTCVEIDTSNRRNLVQAFATEGMICAFFTQLSTSSLVYKYQQDSFYYPFMEKDMEDFDPAQFFSPIENQFIKYFHVLDHYLVYNYSEKAQFSDFLSGYMESFPDEIEQVKLIFQKVFGFPYTEEIPPPLWLMVKDYEHRLLSFDPYGAVTIPVYTFDLNAAEAEDLMTIPGVQEEEAQKIIEFRKANGFYNQLEDLNRIPNLNQSTFLSLQECMFDQDQFESLLADFDENLSLSMLIKKPLIYILSRASIFYLFFFGVYLVLKHKKLKYSRKKWVSLFIWNFICWTLLLLMPIIVLFISPYAWAISSIVIFLFASATWLIFRKQKDKQWRISYFLGMNLLIQIISLL